MAAALPPSASPFLSSDGVRLPLRAWCGAPLLPLRVCATTGSSGCLPDCGRGKGKGRNFGAR